MYQSSDFESQNSGERGRAKRSRSRSPISSQICETEKQTRLIGPALPPHPSPSQNSQECAIIGPALPPHLVDTSPLGPQLPPHLLKATSKLSDHAPIGPKLPPHLAPKFHQSSESESDEEVYGPVPVGDITYTKAQIALEERALQIKIDRLDPAPEVKQREEWMLELPEAKASRFGLGPRQFRSKAGPDLSDRSSWTDAPNKKGKSKEVDLRKEAELEGVKTRNEEQERISKKYKKSKDSLVELHRKKMEEKGEKEVGERRPFSRDIDLQVNRFDEAQKKAILKKAQLLDDRFSSGQSKFL